MKFMICLMAVCVLTSCYRMPGEYDYCTIPATNNPHVTCEKEDALTPALKY